MNDLLSLLRQVTTLVRALEVEAAVARVAEAKRDFERTGDRARAEVVAALNRQLALVRGQRAALRSAIDALPTNERVFAEAQIEGVIDSVFGPELARLRGEKRAVSRAR